MHIAQPTKQEWWLWYRGGDKDTKETHNLIEDFMHHAIYREFKPKIVVKFDLKWGQTPCDPRPHVIGSTDYHQKIWSEISEAGAPQ